MSSLSSRSDYDRVPWPKGTNTNLILPVPNVTETTRKGALAFICGNSYYKLKDDSKRHKPSVEGITPQEQTLSKKIQLESLFLDATGSAVDDDKLIDYCRFQSNPSRQSSLMKSEYIQNIVVSTQNVVKAQCNDYVMTKLSVLFSLPGGQPQGIHIDEVRSPQDVQDEGEMISVIFALQNGTKVDIEVSKPLGRQTYYVPSSSIIMFSGTLRHGGSAYSEENIRLHMYFLPSAAAKDNKRITALQLV